MRIRQILSLTIWMTYAFGASGQSLMYSAPMDITSRTPSFDRISQAVGSEETSPQGLAFSSSGLKMFIIGSDGDEINQYSLTNAFDLEAGVTFDGSPLDVSAQETIPTGLTFSFDGAKLFVVGSNSDEIHQYSLTTPFDVTSGVTYDGSPYDLSFLDSQPKGLTFDPSGTTLFVLGGANETVYQFDLTTPFDITSGVSFNGGPLNVFDEENDPEDLALSPCGTKLFVLGSSVHQYSLANPFNTQSGVTYDGTPFDISGQESAPNGFAFNTTRTTMHLVGEGSDEVYQYTLANSNVFLETVDNTGAVEGSLIVSAVDVEFANPGASLVHGTDFTIDNLPSGLTPTIATDASGNFGTLTLSGTASSHEVADRVADLIFTFAASSLSTPGVDNSVSASSDLGIEFDVSSVFVTQPMIALAESGSVDIDATDGFGGAIDENITYSISGGADASLFSIDASSGLLSFLSAANYENPADNDLDNTYEVSILATSISGSQTDNFFISIVDVTEQVSYSAQADITVVAPNRSDTTFSVSGEMSNTVALHFSNDGSKLFVLGSNGGIYQIYQYTISSPFDITSGVSYDNLSFSIDEDVNTPSDFIMSPDGSKVYVLDDAKKIYQYTLGTAFDLSGGASFDDRTLTLNSTLTPVAIRFDLSGLKLYAFTLSSLQVWEFGLNAPFDITQGFTSSSLVVDIDDPFYFATAASFHSSGDKLFAMAGSDAAFYQYDISTPYDLGSTVSFESPSFDLGAIEANPKDLFITPAGTRLFILGGSNNEIHQFQLRDNAPFKETIADDGSVSGIMDISLSAATFENAGGSLTDGVHYTVTNLPGGLVPQVDVSSSGRVASLTLSGNATSHTPLQDVANLQLTFTDAAFSNELAADIVNAVGGSSNLGIEFDVVPEFITADSVWAVEGTPTIDVDASDGYGNPADENVTYTLISGADQSLFSIDTDSGILTFLSEPDHEAPGDGNTDNVYEVVVRADNAAGTTDLTLEIVVLDRAEHLSYSASVDISAEKPQPTGLSLDLSTQGITTAEDMTFQPDGTRLYVLFDNQVWQYSLSSAYDLSAGVSYDGSPLNVATENNSAKDLAFSLDGSKLFILDGDDQEINQYSLTSAFDVTAGATHDNVSWAVTPQESNPTGICFSMDGTKLFLVGTNAKRIIEYTVPAPYDLSSGVQYTGHSVDISQGDAQPEDMLFDPTGQQVLVVGGTGKEINQFTLSTAYDLSSTLTYLGNPFSVVDEESEPRGIAFNAAATALFLAGQSSDRVWAYDLTSPRPFKETLADDGSVEGEMLISATTAQFTNAGASLTAGVHYTVDNLPAGLSSAIAVSTDGRLGTLSISGTAASHENADDLEALVLSFTDAAFSNEIVSNVNQAVSANTGLGIDFGTEPIFATATSLSIEEGSDELDLDAADGLGSAADNGVTYAITGGADGSLVSVDPNDGTLSFTNAPDFENPQDADTDNAYEVQVTISNGVTSAAYDLTITVVDVVETLQYARSVDLSDPVPTYDNVSFTISTNPFVGQNVTFSPDGGRMFLLNESQKLLEQYSLASPFDLDGTVSIEGVLSLSTHLSNPVAFTFSPSGQRLFAVCSTNDQIIQFDLNDAFDVRAGSTVGADPFDISLTETDPTDVEVSPDGRKLYLLGKGTDKVHQYTFKVPFDVSGGLTLDSNPLDLQVQVSGPQSLSFSIDGSKLLVLDASTEQIHQYTMNTSYDVSAGASYDNVLYDFSAETADSKDFALSPDKTRLFMLADDPQQVFQLDMNDQVAFTENVANDGSVIGDLTIAVKGTTFAHAGSTLSEGTDFTIDNLPSGLSATMSVANDGTSAQLTLSGAAATHKDVDDVDDLVFTFTDAAFVSAAAADVAKAVSGASGFNIDFEGESVLITSSSSSSIDEGTTAALNMNATIGAAGVTDAGITYTISGGTDALQFTIDSSSGELSFMTSPDYEAPGDANSDNVYQVNVEVTDGEETLTQNLLISIVDVNDNNPIFTSDNAPSITENNAAVTTLTATDGDAGTSFTYSITGGVDAALLTVDAATGELSFLTAPDFEAPTDDDLDNRYEIIVNVSDGMNGTSTALSIEVSDANDITPTFTSDSTATLVENQTAIDTLTASDGDAGSTISFDIVGGADGDLFSIDGSTGVLSFDTAPDYENPEDLDGDNIYEVQISVSDGLNASTITYKVTIGDIENEVAPEITSETFAEYTENAVGPILTIQAIDGDPTNVLSYSLAGGADANSFEIDPNTGTLSFLSYPNFESPTDTDGNNIYLVDVSVSDGENIVTETLEIMVVNAEEDPIASDQDFAIDENSPSGTVVGTVTAKDPDEGELSFLILGGNERGTFALNDSTGLLSVVDSTLLDHEVISSIELLVEATDVAGLSVEFTVTITLNDVDESVTEPVLSIADEAAHLSIYPNPTTTYFRLIHIGQVQSVKLYTVSGQLLRAYGPQEGYDITNVPNGLYIVEVAQQRGTHHLRLIVE